MKNEQQTNIFKGNVFKNCEQLVKLITENIKLKQMVESEQWQQTRWSQLRKPLVPLFQQCEHWQIVFRNCLITQVKSFCLKCLFVNFNILQAISQIKFNNLKKLSLQQISLDNIELISILDVICIENISLDTNKITNVKSLKKTNFRNLKRLSLFINPIQNIGHICRMKLSQTQNLIIQNNPMEGYVIQQDISYLLKTEPYQNMKNYGTFMWVRISQRKIRDMLRYKFPNAKN